MHLYRNIFKDSLASVWKNKYLWFFGLFATLIGSTSEYEILFGSSDSSFQNGFLSKLSIWKETGIFSANGWINMGNLAAKDPLAFFILISLLLAILILSIFLVWLTITSQGALVYNSGKIRLEKKHSFKEGLDAGKNKFWPVLTLNLCLKVFLSVLFLLLNLLVIKNWSGSAFSVTGLLFFIGFLLFIPISIILSFITKYAIAFVVIKDEKLVKSVKEGWKLFLDNWLVSLEMAFLLFAISFISAIALIMTFLVLAVPILFIVVVFSSILAYVNFMVIILCAMIFYIIAIIIFGSFLTAFQIGAWTNLFIELISRGGASKLNRIFSQD